MAPTSNGGTSPQTAAREELDHARATFERLSAEYEGLLADPDAIQEDRDSQRLLVEQARGELERAEQAVAAADAGQYGVCVKCGGPIGAERLEALPTTQTCVNCS